MEKEIKLTKEKIHFIYAMSDRDGKFKGLVMLPNNYVLSEEYDDDEGVSLCSFIDDKTHKVLTMYFIDKIAIISNPPKPIRYPSKG